MRAKDNLRRIRVGEPGQCLIHFLDQRIQIKRVTIKRFDAMRRHVVMEQTPPLVEAAARRGARILRIKRKQHNFIALCCPELLDRFRRERMPVAHSHKTTCVQAILGQLRLQSAGLLLGKAPDWRRSANRRIMVLHFLGPRGRDQPGQRLAS